MMCPELIITEDGSHSLFVPSLDESYHSSHGALQESQHIFVEAGLKETLKSSVDVLEIGFGTGLNAFLTWIEAERSGRQVCYTAVEKFPVAPALLSQLNYSTTQDPEFFSFFERIHAASWGEKLEMSSHFSLRKIEADFTHYVFLESYDLIFFDAFSPEKQPEMWTGSLFRKLYEHANADAILTTYCAKGAVRRVLQAAGFVVERIPGPPGKREILRARKW